MKRHLNHKDKTDIRNWLHQGIGERIKASLFLLFGGFLIMLFILQSSLPKGSSFGTLTLGFTMLLTPSVIAIIIFNISLNRHNREVKKFKQMTEEQQSEYLSRRN